MKQIKIISINSKFKNILFTNTCDKKFYKFTNREVVSDQSLFLEGRHT